MLLREFELLERLLQSRPFLLGSHPSIADFGYFGPMFCHFGNDPDPAEVMRRHAPKTCECVARRWNARQQDLPEQPQWRWPEEDFWQPLLRRIARDYLPCLHQKALARGRRAPRFDFQGDNLQFPETRATTSTVCGVGNSCSRHGSHSRTGNGSACRACSRNTAAWVP
jgi:hypothetical protein